MLTTSRNIKYIGYAKDVSGRWLSAFVSSDGFQSFITYKYVLNRKSPAVFFDTKEEAENFNKQYCDRCKDNINNFSVKQIDIDTMEIIE